MTASDITGTAQRDSLLRAMGIVPEALVWPDPQLSRNDPVAERTRKLGPLTDAEWDLISPLMPDEAPQACTMAVRAFVDAVIQVVRGDCRWTDLGTPEPVRRRFARWSHKGLWQGLAEALAEAELNDGRTRDLVRVAQRADRLRARAASRRR